MTDENALLIFVKNPVLGKVKTRLAATLGDEKALAIYHQLLQHTAQTAQQIKTVDKIVFYSDEIVLDDCFPNEHFQKQVQLQHPDLGERMLAAFAWAKARGYYQIVIIGSDCLELQPLHLHLAFAVLQSGAFVLGPAKDGGYYLLGMKELFLHGSLFQNKTWSHAHVFANTLADMKAMGQQPFLLPTLSDVDEEGDLI